MRRVLWVMVLVIAPVAVVIAYMMAQDVVRVRIDAAGARMQSGAKAAKYYKPAGASDVQVSPEDMEEFKLHLAEFATLSSRVAPKLLPRGLGVALGVWAGFVVGGLLSLRGERGWSSRSKGRVWKLAAPHVLGVSLTALGLIVVALVGAHLNALWQMGFKFSIVAVHSPARVPQFGVVLFEAAPPAAGAMMVVCGAQLLYRGSRGSTPRPFLRLSRARAWSLVVAGLGAALVLFAVASVEIMLNDLAAKGTLGVLANQYSFLGYFDVPLGNASLTEIAAWVGVALFPAGLAASVVIPMRLRRRPGYLAGARECVDCAHPLLEGQSTCPECGAVH